MRNTSTFRPRIPQAGGSVLVLLLLVVIVTSADPRFLSTTNLINVLRIASITVLAVYGQTFVLLTGQIDLSMGSVASMVSVVLGMSLSWYGVPLFPSVLIALLAGSALGFLNGILIFRFKLPSFITTFGMLTSLAGLANFLTRSTPIELVDTPGFDFVGRGYIGPIPIAVIVAVVAFAILRTVLTHTTFGRTVYAMGCNSSVAVLSGRRVTRAGIGAYTLAGFLVAVTAVIMSSRIYSAQPDLAPALAYDAIAAAAIGGVSLLGGRGNLVQASVGALIIAVLLNGLTLVNVSTYMQMVTRGGIIILAVAANNVRDTGLISTLRGALERKSGCEG